MVTNESFAEKNLNTKICSLCKKGLPPFKKDETYNFCPHILNGKLADVCIECKTKFIKAKWSK